MLFTCLFLLPHVNYALNVILVQVVDKSYFEMAPPTLHTEMRHLLRPKDDRCETRSSGFAPIVFWRIWALETIVNNLKSIANFGNLNVYFLYQWNLLGGRLLVKCVLG